MYTPGAVPAGTVISPVVVLMVTPAGAPVNVADKVTLVPITAFGVTLPKTVSFATTLGTVPPVEGSVTAVSLIASIKAVPTVMVAVAVSHAAGITAGLVQIW